MLSLGEERYAPPSERGVLYFNTVPRDMRPQEIRLHFNQYGVIRRMKFIPFPKKARRPGGPLLPLQYKEGWMEFTSVDDAQHAAQCMNGQPVDVKRQRRCYGQLWTVRFMRDFTWDSLLEEAEGQRRARRAADVEARREERSMNEMYRRMVLQAEKQRKLRSHSCKKVREVTNHDEEASSSTTIPPVATKKGILHRSSGAECDLTVTSVVQSRVKAVKTSERLTAKKCKRRKGE